MKQNKRMKIISIALVATLACSSSVTGVFAATPQMISEIDVNAVTAETEHQPTEQDSSEQDFAEPLSLEGNSVEPMQTTQQTAVENASARAASVAIDETNFPDANFRAFVKQYDIDRDEYLSEAEIAAVTTINCSSKSIASLKGIEYFTALRGLNCQNNQLTSLDVSSNTALEILFCDNNQLTALDISGCTMLINLYCHSNQLTSLDVNNNTALTDLRCYNNQLTTLDVNNNTALTKLYCNNNQLTTLEVSGCTALELLQCNNNQLTTLEVSGCTTLQTLYCYINQLTTLDVSGCTALQSLQCRDNQLTTLDVSNHTALTYLNCGLNQLTSMDVSNNTALATLYCYDNQLTTLDVSNNTALTDLRCYNNQLTTLDLSNNTALTNLRCYNNQLTSLALSNHPNMVEFNGEQWVNLLQIPRDSYDLLQYDPNIDGAKITNVTGATFNGTVMSGYTQRMPITYDYDCGNGQFMHVNILPVVTSNIIYKDGSNDFNGWKTDYIAPSTYEEGTSVTLPTADSIAKEGYTFVGWYDNEAGTGAPITEIDAAAIGNQILYAKFEANQYTVNFKDWDGTVLATQQVAYNTAATAPTAPTREGYRFTGWSAEFDNVTGDMEITAQYEEKATEVLPTEPQQPQTSEQDGEMSNTTATGENQLAGTNLQTAQTGDNHMVEPLLVTGGISSLAAAFAFFFKKKKKSEE